MSFRPRSLALPLVIVAILVALAIPKIREISQKKEKGQKTGAAGPGKGPGAGGAPTPVSIIVVKPQNLENKIQATGSIVPEEQVQVSSEIAGQVTKVLFEEGSRVRSGQVLVHLESAELRAQLQRLEAQQRLNRQTEERTRALLTKEYISRQEYDQVLANFQATEADLARARAQLAKATIRAPFDGVIGLQNISKGAFLTPGAPVANLIKIKPVKIDFPYPRVMQAPFRQVTKCASR